MLYRRSVFFPTRLFLTRIELQPRLWQGEVRVEVFFELQRPCQLLQRFVSIAYNP